MISSLGTVVFARTPQNVGKSRLAKTWNRAATDTFYLHCLDCAAQWLQEATNHSAGYWALTGEGSRQDIFWKSGNILEQGAGGLGERMASVSAQLLRRHDFWCLVGSDIPQMPALTELALCERLQHSTFVFGPSLDGGFWLVAGRRALPLDIWTTVPYSCSNTLEKMISALITRNTKWQIDTSLPLLNDIDHYADLLYLFKTLQEMRPSLSRPQSRLLEWLGNQHIFTGEEK